MSRSEKSRSWASLGRSAVHEQVGRLGEEGLFGQILDGDAPVAQDTLVAVDEGDVALAGTRIAVARVQGDIAGVVAQGGDVDGLFTLGSQDDGILVGLAFQDDFRFLRHFRTSEARWGHCKESPSIKETFCVKKR